MRLLLFSDSHGNRSGIAAMVKKAAKLGPIDAVLFAGDGANDPEALDLRCPVFAVRGNCDLFSTAPEQLVLPFAGHLVYLCHGHHHQVKRGLDQLAAVARQQGAGIAVYGHSHAQAFALVDRVHCINPGALYDGAFALLALEAGGAVKPQFFQLYR